MREAVNHFPGKLNITEKKERVDEAEARLLQMLDVLQYQRAAIMHRLLERSKLYS